MRIDYANKGKRAMHDIERRIKAAAKQAVWHRNYRRARDRALARLSHAYPNHYRELLEEEKRADERESKKWIDISGATDPVGISGDTNIKRATARPRNDTTSRETQTRSEAYEGDLEGEES